MNGYSDDPFQMDEEMNDGSRKGSSIGSKRSEVYFENVRMKPTEKDIYKNNVDHNITPQYEDINEKAFLEDREEIRSRLTGFRLNEDLNTSDAKEEVDQVYEEDLDDKLDGNTICIDKTNNDHEEDHSLTPPQNFAPIINNIYRSSFPQPQNFSFIKKLKLKSVLCLIPEEYPEPQKQFLEEHNIKLFQQGMSGNKEPFVKISSELITEAIKIALNPENHPILIHCNRGKHRTGCLVGVIRRLQQWSLTIIFDEYRKFAAPKERPMDQQFIELYDENEVTKYCIEHKYLPLRWD